ncbi:MFS general substrate transporter [Pluteus cervinus]|uniref:MFS general substrate transporter n=1 Tax=Pluteus cervinus TaxID=181527 RepID=A0ACD3B5S4_9AGAR|nr:MFS general substrate transporter [Pluteus cervinus]
MASSLSSAAHRKSSAEDVVKEGLVTDEKSVQPSSSINLQDGDEALQLIGVERSAHFSDEYNAKLRMKLDMVIPPIAAVVFFIGALDKTSLNYASIMGFPIVGQHYNLVSLAIYLGFIAWQFPTIFISQRIRMAKWLGANIIGWGIVLMLHASATSFRAFFALRFLLGLCESCTTPSLVLIIGMFYKKNEQASRISWYYAMASANGLASVFGGFVAYGISFDKEHGLPPYKILYILLGGLSILIGICVLIWLPDSPVHARFLSQEERIAALERVRDDQGGTKNKTFKKYQMIEAFTDIRTWFIVLSTFLTSIPNGALTNFSNLVIKSFGYTSKQTLILSTPAGVIGALATLFVGRYSDKKNERILPIVFCLVPTIIGSAILIGLNRSGHKGALLFAIYIIGTFSSAIPLIFAYIASNTSGFTKRATVNAMTLVAFSVGNITGTEIFQPKDAPDYIPGKIAIMVLLIVAVFVCFTLRWINIHLNNRKQVQVAELKARRGWSDADMQKERDRHAFADLTDYENIYFVYTA